MHKIQPAYAPNSIPEFFGLFFGCTRGMLHMYVSVEHALHVWASDSACLFR